VREFYCLAIAQPSVDDGTNHPVLTSRRERGIDTGIHGESYLLGWEVRALSIFSSSPVDNVFRDYNASITLLMCQELILRSFYNRGVLCGNRWANYDILKLWWFVGVAACV
jgi:hypothetical protein